MTDRLPGSFRDPSGFVYRRDGVLLRLVRPSYREHYDRLLASGLYDRLVRAGLLVTHDEEDAALAPPGEEVHRILRPEPVPFVSYPYEWSFRQLRDAALVTLEVQEAALAHGMALKDASAYNVQFFGSRPVLVDTLSFETYREGRPWVAYRQFCQHFLAPLSLAAYRDARLMAATKAYLDGFPLDLASKLLPGRTRARPSLLLHLHAHARLQSKYGGRPEASRRAQGQVSLRALRGLVASLRAAVSGLNPSTSETEWGGYREEESYGGEGLRAKEASVERFLENAGLGRLWDLGANAGRFSRLASRRGIYTVALDGDASAADACYAEARRNSDGKLLPLVMDLSNPSPGLGWEGTERLSLFERGPADAALALALVHHLAIGNNVPLPGVASFLARCAPRALVEFVPKEDPKVRRMLASREDVFRDYSKEAFEQAVSGRFRLHAAEPVPGTCRILYTLHPR